MPTKPPLLLRPFAGVLPARDKAHLVATRSYLTYSDYELKDKLARNPYSYLHVIHPEGDLRSSFEWSAVRGAYGQFLEKGWLEADADEHYYVLRQSGPLGACTGVVGLIPTAEAQRGRIKVHEATLADREALFARYLSEVGLNAEPTLLGHAPNAHVDAAVASVTAGPADFDFTTADGVRHTLWRPDHAGKAAIAAAFATVSEAYIADGHHRVASSIRMAEAHPDYPESHAFMALMLPGDQLIFKGYHRVLRDIAPAEMARGMAAITRLDGAHWTPGETAFRDDRATIALRGATCGSLDIQHALSSGNLTAAEWLQHKVLGPIFGIREPRTDRRLHYFAGDLSPDDLTAASSSEDQLCFVMPAMGFESLCQVADDGRHLPPKSTWIAPKLRSGLTLFDFGRTS